MTFIIGICLNMAAAEISDKTPLWLPVPVFVGFVIITLSLWAAVRAQDEKDFKEAMREDAYFIESGMQEYVLDTYSALDRLAQRCEFQHRTPEDVWRKDVEKYLEYFPTLASISWVKADNHLGMAMPKEIEPILKKFDFSKDKRPWADYSGRPRNRRTAINRYFDVPDRWTRWLWLLPPCLYQWRL